MKYIIKLSIIILGLLLSSGYYLHAQFLKSVLNTVKQTVQNRSDEKATSATNKALDQVDDLGKKKPAANSTNSPSATKTSPSDTIPNAKNPQRGAGSNAGGTASTDNSYNSNGSFINLTLSSDRIIAGGAVQITGSSVRYQNFTSVDVTITSADGSGKESRSLPLDTGGVFSTIWQLNSDGDYLVTAKSSDGKNHISKPLGVFKPDDIDSVIKPLRDVTVKAADKLNADIDKVKGMLTGPDASALQKKTDDFSNKKDKLLKQLDDVSAAGKGLTAVEKKYGGLPSSVLKNLSDMTNAVSEQTSQVEQAVAATDHKSYDNSVCEYLVMVSEACAAFSTFTNFEGKFTKILTNLAGDKAGRAVAGYNAGSITGSDAAGKASGECASLFIGAATETEALKANFNPLSFGGDIVQMCSDLLLKKYCAVMSGDLTQTYECTFRNKSNNVWWDYTYSAKAIISLRYPKNNAGGNIIKMKGNIEGNATKFTIFQDAQQIDDYKDAMKGREALTKFYAIQLHAPTAIPFSAAAADKDIGFGAVARSITVPASFNLPIDGDYDVAQKKITIHVNDALVDFTPVVCYIYGYISIAAGIPLVTRVNYPISSVRLTLGKVIEKNSKFNVKTDAQNNISVDGDGETKIGDASSSIEHNISFSFRLLSEK